MISAIVGTNWGDEGKGRMVDLLGEQYDIIVRYQGGNNAGHTVINHRGKFILNLLPSGILRESTVNVMGPGMVIDIEHLCGEIKTLQSQGIKITPDNLKISEKATICFPFHRQQDVLEEDRLGDEKYGSTRRGIAPVYSDKYSKKGVRMGELFEFDYLATKMPKLVEWKNLTIVGGYKAEEVSAEDMLNWLKEFGTPLLPYIMNTEEYLNDSIDNGKNVMFEAQLGALRDIDYGIYPYTSSSTVLSAYAPIGGGIPGRRLEQVIGITKAYSSCVGEGAFTCEMFGEEAKALRDAGGEYGAATGRPRRVGGFDIPATKYGVRTQGCDILALTKMDVLSYMKEIPVCVAYEVDGVRTTVFPTGEALNRAKPIYEYLPGFNCDVSNCKKVEDLPKAALDYVRYIENAINCKVKYLSVGADREQYIEMF